MWYTPKTNWASTDYFNIGDYNRIANNIEWIRNKAQGVYGNIPFETMPLTMSYSSYPYARILNAIENNLDTLNQKTYRLNIGTKKTYYDNYPTWDYIELNRIENAIANLKVKMDADIQRVFVLPMRLGNQRGIRV